MSSVDATASDGSGLDLDSCPTVLHYNVAGDIDYIDVVSSGHTYRQTFTYAGTALTAVSAWSKQP